MVAGFCVSVSKKRMGGTACGMPDVSVRGDIQPMYTQKKGNQVEATYVLSAWTDSTERIIA